MELLGGWFRIRFPKDLAFWALMDQLLMALGFCDHRAAVLRCYWILVRTHCFGRDLRVTGVHSGLGGWFSWCFQWVEFFFGAWGGLIDGCA